MPYPLLRARAAQARAEGVRAEQAREQAEPSVPNWRKPVLVRAERCLLAPVEVPVPPVVAAKPLVASRLTLSSEGMASIVLPASRRGADGSEPPSEPPRSHHHALL